MDGVSHVGAPDASAILYSAVSINTLLVPDHYLRDAKHCLALPLSICSFFSGNKFCLLNRLEQRFLIYSPNVSCSNLGRGTDCPA